MFKHQTFVRTAVASSLLTVLCSSPPVHAGLLGGGSVAGGATGAIGSSLTGRLGGSFGPSTMTTSGALTSQTAAQVSGQVSNQGRVPVILSPHATDVVVQQAGSLGGTPSSTVAGSTAASTAAGTAVAGQTQTQLQAQGRASEATVITGEQDLSQQAGRLTRKAHRIASVTTTQAVNAQSQASARSLGTAQSGELYGLPVRFARKPATSPKSYTGRVVRAGIASGFKSVG